jgi:hypothetical protein
VSAECSNSSHQRLQVPETHRRSGHVDIRCLIMFHTGSGESVIWNVVARLEWCCFVSRFVNGSACHSISHHHSIYSWRADGPAAIGEHGGQPGSVGRPDLDVWVDAADIGHPADQEVYQDKADGWEAGRGPLKTFRCSDVQTSISRSRDGDLDCSVSKAGHQQVFQDYSSALRVTPLFDQCRSGRADEGSFGLRPFGALA